MRNKLVLMRQAWYNKSENRGEKRMNLPKSNRARFSQCPKMLRQGTYHPELAVQDEALLRILQIPKQYRSQNNTAIPTVRSNGRRFSILQEFFRPLPCASVSRRIRKRRGENIIKIGGNYGGRKKDRVGRKIRQKS